MKRYISLMLTILVLAVFGYYVVDNKESFEALKQVPLLHLVIVGLCQILLVFMNGLFLKVIALPFKKDVPLGQSFIISIWTAIGNYFTPFRGGAGIRAVYLKKNFQLAYSDFLATLYGNYIVVFFVNALIGLVALGVIYVSKNEFNLMLFIALWGVLVGTLFLMIFNGRINENESNLTGSNILKKILQVLLKISNGWTIIKSQKGLIKKLSVITLCNTLVMISISYIEFRAINESISLVGLVLYSSLASLSLLLSITPGSLGIKEAIFIFSAGVLGVGNDQILQVAVIDRGILFIVLALLFVFLKLFGIGEKILKLEKD